MLPKKILIGHKEIRHLLMSLFAAAIGITIFLLTNQSARDINRMFQQTPRIFARNYLIINKEVSLLNTLVIDAEFSETEIAELRQQPFISEVVKFSTSGFMVRGSVAFGGSGRVLNSELFFESIPDQYIDIDSNRWDWRPGDNEIPVVVPRDYLTLYNFGYAPGNSLPQISEKAISSISFDVELYNDSGKLISSKARIVDFSDRINTILAPKSFLDWSNQQLAEDNNQQGASRVLLVADSSMISQVEEFLIGKNYQTNQEKLVSSKQLAGAALLLNLFSLIGLIIMFLALYLLAVGLQLTLYRNNELIRLLLHLGHSPKKLKLFYRLFAAVVTTAAALLALPVTVLIRGEILSSLQKLLLASVPQLDIFFIISIVLIIVLPLLFNSFLIGFQFKKIFNS